MGKSKAYKVKVHTSQYKTGVKDVNNYVHQTSPGWVLTFVRWENRDVFRYDKNRKPEESKYKAISESGPLNTISPPLVVINDCVTVSVNSQKSSHTPSMSAVLKGGDINYLTAIAPGDFVFVNMVDWDFKALVVAQKAKNREPINDLHDGFKGVFKVQSVRLHVKTEPSSGIKVFYYHITGYGFTELNNTIYFNDQNLNPAIDKSDRAAEQYFARTGIEINQLASEGPASVQTVVKKMVQLVLVGPNSSFEDGRLITSNKIYRVPEPVFDLLGIKASSKTAIEMFRFLFGIQQYLSESNTISIPNGLNPSNRKTKDSDNSIFTELADPCQGLEQLRVQYWNGVNGWSLISQHANLLLNELYTTFKVDYSGKVMPTVVFRQKPFTSEKPIVDAKATKFLSLPRWEIPTEMIYEMNIGRDEALRNNFVQIFANLSTIPGTGSVGALAEQAQNNWVADFNDIERSGLKPSLYTTNHDIPYQTEFQSPIWARILADMLFGQHLKMTGTVVTAGIEEPISVGDNAQIAGTVYHIESVTHMCSISPNGEKKFETRLGLSNGVDARGENSILKFSQMENIDIQDEIKQSFLEDQVYPGLGDTQFSFSRSDNGDTKKIVEKPKLEPKEIRNKKTLISSNDASIKNVPQKKSKGGR
jgi:hypothetical protein